MSHSYSRENKWPIKHDTKWSGITTKFKMFPEYKIYLIVWINLTLYIVFLFK